MFNTPSPPAITLALGVLLCATGCNQTHAELHRENVQLREKLKDANDRIASQDLMLGDLREQLKTARGLSEADRAAIISPTKLILGRLTGAEDYDGTPGHDGVTAHFQLLDDVGDPIKVTGDVTIELFDLSAGEPRRISVCEFGPEEVRKMWISTLLTYMYTIECPFEQRPSGTEVTVRVTFRDYLSRQSLSAQTSVSVAFGDEGAGE